MALARAIATLGGWTMASRLLGFYRDILFAGILGTGMVADAFFVAFKFPNFFRRLFAEGAFNSAFVPLFSERLTREGIGPARRFAANVAGVMVAFMLCFTVLMQLAMPWLMYAIAPGFSEDPAKFGLAIALTRLTFPYLTFMSLAALLAGMLNSLHRFAAAAAAPMVLNIVLIAALTLIRGGYVELPGHAIAVAVSIAGAGQFVLLVLACRRAGIMVRLPRPRLTPGVRRVFRLMVPGLIGAGVVQVNLVVDVVLASLLPQGSVSWLYYADRVNQLPLGVVGVAVGVALLPMLSRHLSAGDEAAAAHTQNRAIEFALLLTLPAAAALLTIPASIVGVLFQRGAFGTADAGATAGALAAFAAGLPAYVLIKALTPGFFARQDTKTPVKIAVSAMAANIVFAVVLMQVLAHVGIALATACSAWLNAATLAVVLHRRGQLRFDTKLRAAAPRIAAAALVMAAALWAVDRALAPLFAGGPEARVLALAVLVAAGLLAYGAVVQATGAARLGDLRASLRRR
jgi:putative peptidoglycan lipid II flippase